MTLVVAKVTTNQIIILSDTRKTDPLQQRQTGDIKGGLLKTTFLSKSIAVSFTGDPDIAQRHVRSFLARHDAPGFRSVLHYFTGATVDNENEYIVGFAGPKRIFHVRSGEANERKVAWIGDKAAFERFQEGATVSSSNVYRRATTIFPDVSDQKFVIDQIDRFQGVIEDNKVTSTGDFFTAAVSNGGLFRFISIGTLFFDADSKILGPNGLPFLSSTGENRAFRFAIWFPRQRNVASIAFVFPEIERAYVFHSRNLGFADECTIFDGFAREALADQIEQKLGVKFEVFELRHF